MSEMLGNYFFLFQRYSDALLEYKNTLEESNIDSSLGIKYFICLLKLHRYNEALEFFDRITANFHSKYNSNSIEAAIITNLIDEIENSNLLIKSVEKNYLLGILWSFCDKQKAIRYFQKIARKNKNFRNVKYIISEFINKNKPNRREKWKTNKSQEKIS